MAEIVSARPDGTTTIDVGPLTFGDVERVGKFWRSTSSNAWQARLLVTFDQGGSGSVAVLGYRKPSDLPAAIGWTGGEAFRWLFPKIAARLDEQAAAWFAANAWRLSRDAARAAA